MPLLYNCAVNIVEYLLDYRNILPNSQQKKWLRFVKGHNNLMNDIEQTMALCDYAHPIYWFHAASLGEYGVARPIIKSLKEAGKCTIVLTFFSPTGVDALTCKHENVDYIFYLPIDTRSNARRFLDAVRPDMAVFMVSEYWYNFLHELQVRHIPSYLISALIRKDSVFFKWYGSMYRKILNAYTHIFVLDDESYENLQKLGYNKVTISGDPLFDNARQVASTKWENDIIHNFAQTGPLFVAGSIHDDEDLKMVAKLANNHQDTHFVIVPHEISEEGLNHIKAELDGIALLYSECDENTNFNNVQTLIVDFMGGLAYLYRYAYWVYVGGGFTPLLHNIIEATVYGLPVAFGPCIKRKATAREMIKLGIGFKVCNYTQLNRWFLDLKGDDEQMRYFKQRANDYVRFNLGATQTITQAIIKEVQG